MWLLDACLVLPNPPFAPLQQPIICVDVYQMETLTFIAKPPYYAGVSTVTL